MASTSTYLENAILNAVLRNTAYTSPATVYAALFTTATDDGSGGLEVTGGSYARTAVTFGAPVDGVISNSGIVTFPTSTADWGTVSHMALYDAVTDGNRLYHAALTVPKAMTSGMVFTFPVGDVEVTLT